MMKNLLLFGAIFFCAIGNAQIIIGDNPGYYGTLHTDQQIYDLAFRAGARSARPGLSLQQYVQFGSVNPFLPSFNYPASIGMSGNTFFLYITDGPNYSGQSDSIYGGKQTLIPNGLWLPAFNPDGSINQNNLWAKYCYDVISPIISKYKYFEVDNEPDLSGSADAYEDSTVSSTSWQIREPQPEELQNLNAPLEDYVQMCKVANQVIKSISASALITTGGLGYPFFYQWFLRKGGGEWIDILSIHDYPYFDWCVCHWNGSICDTSGFHRNSDYAVSAMMNKVNQFKQIETNENSIHHPVIMTETNIPRWSYVRASALDSFPNNRAWGNDTVQRNFAIKSILKLYQASVNQIYFFQTGEMGDSGLNNGTTLSENDAMGFYKNLTKAAPGSEQLTEEGFAMRILDSMNAKFSINKNLLPIQILSDGVELDSSGTQMFVLWPQTNRDRSENAFSVYKLPAGEWNIFDWRGNFNRVCVDTIQLSELIYCKPKNPVLSVIVQRDSSITEDITAEIYPNPSTGQFNVKVGSKTYGSVLIQVYDSYGRLRKFFTGFKRQFYYVNSLSTCMESGTYIVKIDINGEQEIIKKIIVAK